MNSTQGVGGTGVPATPVKTVAPTAADALGNLGFVESSSSSILDAGINAVAIQQVQQKSLATGMRNVSNLTGGTKI